MSNPLASFFSSKKSTEMLPIDSAVKNITASLKIQSISVNYNVDRLTKYYATINYSERPNNFKDRGMTREVNIDGQDWADLIRKVTQHLTESELL